MPLAKLTPAHVERMTAELVASGRSPGTASHARVTLRRALSDAVRDGLVHRNVAVQALDERLADIERRVRLRERYVGHPAKRRSTSGSTT